MTSTGMAAVTCGWRTGAEPPGAQPALCGKPAKNHATGMAHYADSKLLCGIHARSATAVGFTVEPLPPPRVRSGQVWVDLDPRGPVRHIRVIGVVTSVEGVPVPRPHAVVVRTDANGEVRGRETRTTIRLDRFQPTPTGYLLARDVVD